jgi:beta-glucosidase
MVPCYYTRLPGASCDYLEGDRSPLYPFGHGLSYTKFEYSDLALNPLGGCDCEVSFTVTNVGDRDGDEVVQVYINDPESSVVTPDKLLRKFRRLTLAAGESRRVNFTLGFDDFKLLGLDWQWKVEPGEFRVMVGASSADIRLEGSFEVE